MDTGGAVSAETAGLNIDIYLFRAGEGNAVKMTKPSKVAGTVKAGQTCILVFTGAGLGWPE